LRECIRELYETHDVGVSFLSLYHMEKQSTQDFKLFWVSVLLLFLELLIIRWLSAELRIFAYFHNLLLIICFLGIGLGCALPRKNPPLLLSLAILGALVFFVYCPWNLGFLSLSRITLYLGNLKDFIIWYQAASTGLQKIRELALGIGMLALLAIGIIYLFVPFGQMLGELLKESERPLRAYTINILGSLAGIVLFTVLSFLSSPPVYWFAVFFVIVLVVLPVKESRKLLLPSALLMVATLAVLFSRDFRGREGEHQEIWSPYQKLEVKPLDYKTAQDVVRVGYIINVNSVPYQQAVNLSYDFVRSHPHIYGFTSPEMLKFDHYNLPYLFGKHLDEVLIVGAGTGNDIAGALRNGAGHIDAVEIDPVIIDVGERLHPEQPYASERVTRINDDARSYFHRTKKKYDLIVFGLLDSHTLSSNLSNVRLDNFVYTQQSIEEASTLLKPEGALVLIFDVRDHFIGQSLYGIMNKVFDYPPLCFRLKDTVRGWGGSVFIGGNQLTISQTIMKYPVLSRLTDPSFSKAGASKAIPTDDWPYLYLNGRWIPSLYYIIFGLLLLISVVLVRRNFSGLNGINWHFFFLGAGFLLIEVQNVSKLALLFGATWMVNSIIIGAIMIMILLANYYVSLKAIESHGPYYVGLAFSLLLIYFFPLGKLAAMPFWSKAAVSGIVLSIPIFFAGVIFAHSFRKAKQLNAVFASNLIGAMLGGMLECASFVIGIKALLLLALLLYFLSYVSVMRKAEA
jgi:SAM-dependent methyltransferase